MKSLGTEKVIPPKKPRPPAPAEPLSPQIAAFGWKHLFENSKNGAQLPHII
jgi:hypothetical protein